MPDEYPPSISVVSEQPPVPVSPAERPRDFTPTVAPLPMLEAQTQTANAVLTAAFPISALRVV
jgi:hypothetical protein